MTLSPFNSVKGQLFWEFPVRSKIAQKLITYVVDHPSNINKQHLDSRKD